MTDTLEIHAQPNIVFQALFALSSLIAGATPNERYHKVNAPVAALAIGAYIVVLFNRIG